MPHKTPQPRSVIDELHNIAIFNQVIESGSFSKAAVALNIAKSSVSKRIRALETKLNLILIQRSTRQLTITDEGWSLYKHSQRIMLELDQATNLVSRLSEVPQGTLRVSAPPLFGRSEIAPLLAKFQQRYPDVIIELYLTEKYSDMIAERFDISVRMGPLPDSGLVMQPLCMVEAVCCASPHYLDARGTPSSLTDLAHHDCIVWRSDDRKDADTWYLQRDNHTEKVRVKSSITTNDHTAIKNILLEDGGISVLPLYTIKEELKQGQLVRLLTNYHQLNFPISILYPQRENIPAKTRAFVSFLKEHIT
ncbi:MAG: LysR family transcriptional regulator [Cellvibrionaceae bacterium]